MEKEKVIFRREYNPYMKQWQYLACFPEEQANPGRIAAVSFYFDGHNKAHFEPFCEIDRLYYLKTRIIHKKDTVISEVLSAIENYYDQKFRVMEKINY